MTEKPVGSDVSRRALFQGGASTAATLPFLGAVLKPEPAAGQGAAASPGEMSEPTRLVELVVNARTARVALDIRTTLLDALREHIGLTGTKKGCDHGQCGACTVHMGGVRTLSCLTLAASVRKPITTIEGVARSSGELHPMQQAFIDHDALQCGYCTPGQIMSAIACIWEGHAGTDEEIREYMSGNICRCAAYPHIVKAIKQAKAEMARL